MTQAQTMPASDPWLGASRVEAWAGEIRVNLVRLVAIVLFYARHLIEWAMASPDAPVRGRYHVIVTVVVVAWALEAFVLHVWLLRRHYSPAILYGAILWDAALITGLCLASGGPRTPLLLLYFPLIASAPLRLSLGAVYAATASAMAGYLVYLGHYAWVVVGFRRYYASPPLRVPRSEEAIVLLAMLVCGLMAGQLVRQVRRMVTIQLSIAPPSGEGP